MDFLRIVWCDNRNQIRAKALRLSDENQKFHVEISPARQCQ